MHATILGGVLLGVLGFLILMRFSAGPGDPFRVELLGAGADPSGGVALAFSIVNEADSSRVADCRVTRDGVPRPDDLAFRTQRLPAGERVLVERVVPPAPTEIGRLRPRAPDRRLHLIGAVDRRRRVGRGDGQPAVTGGSCGPSPSAASDSGDRLADPAPRCRPSAFVSAPAASRPAVASIARWKLPVEAETEAAATSGPSAVGRPG